MTITIWVKGRDLEDLDKLIKRMESTVVLDSEIRD